MKMAGYNVISQTDPITRALEGVHRQFIDDTAGAVAEYIPQLANVDPDLFGIALASMQGRIYAAGDADHLFTIQSVSKPFVYAMALTELGLEETLGRVGAEPSGEAFNAISLEPGTGRPANPMVNAGAIVTTSLVHADGAEARFERIRATLSEFAGRELVMDQAVYESELETGDMNRALAYLMRNAGSLRGDVDEALDVYFRQCALLVSARDLAVMGATLANGGRNPVTRRQIVTEKVAAQVLTVMATCGMYDFSGEWLLRVGLPAKSGVSGALIATSPAEFGIGLFSPRLDDRGNSVRGVEVCRELSDRFDLHGMNPAGHTVPDTFFDETGTANRSSAPRSEHEVAVLEERRERIAVRGVPGDLTFASAEAVLQSFDPVMKSEDDVSSWIVLDLDRVAREHRAGSAVIEAMALDLGERRVTMVSVDRLQRGMIAGVREFTTLDAAVEWCEDELLAEQIP